MGGGNGEAVVVEFKMFRLCESVIWFRAKVSRFESALVGVVVHDASFARFFFDGISRLETATGDPSLRLRQMYTPKADWKVSTNM